MLMSRRENEAGFKTRLQLKNLKVKHQGEDNLTLLTAPKNESEKKSVRH